MDAESENINEMLYRSSCGERTGFGSPDGFTLGETAVYLIVEKRYAELRILAETEGIGKLLPYLMAALRYNRNEPGDTQASYYNFYECTAAWRALAELSVPKELLIPVALDNEEQMRVRERIAGHLAGRGHKLTPAEKMICTIVGHAGEKEIMQVVEKHGEESLPGVLLLAHDEEYQIAIDAIITLNEMFYGEPVRFLSEVVGENKWGIETRRNAAKLLLMWDELEEVIPPIVRRNICLEQSRLFRKMQKEKVNNATKALCFLVLGKTDELKGICESSLRGMSTLAVLLRAVDEAAGSEDGIVAKAALEVKQKMGIERGNWERTLKTVLSRLPRGDELSGKKRMHRPGEERTPAPADAARKRKC